MKTIRFVDAMRHIGRKAQAEQGWRRAEAQGMIQGNSDGSGRSA